MNNLTKLERNLNNIDKNIENIAKSLESLEWVSVFNDMNMAFFSINDTVIMVEGKKTFEGIDFNVYCDISGDKEAKLEKLAEAEQVVKAKYPSRDLGINYIPVQEDIETISA